MKKLIEVDPNENWGIIDEILAETKLPKENILNLTLRKKWFDMIASGEKKEEYREKKEYWDRRLYDDCKPRPFTHIIFKNGYAKDAPMLKVECLGISIGTAKGEWSDNWQGNVFIIKLGKITEQSNH